MQAYQLHATTALADCCHLILIPVGRSLRTASQGRTGRTAGAERYAVPHSPGRARRSYPYPLGRRRGRR